MGANIKKAVNEDVEKRQKKLDTLKAKILAERAPKPRPPFQPVVAVEGKHTGVETKAEAPYLVVEVAKLRKQVASLIESLKEDYGCSDEEIQEILGQE